MEYQKLFQFVVIRNCRLFLKFDSNLFDTHRMRQILQSWAAVADHLRISVQVVPVTQMCSTAEPRFRKTECSTAVQVLQTMEY